MTDTDPEALTGSPESYSSRPRPETSRQVWWNRISVTTGLFTTAISTAIVLGRKH